MKKAEPIFELPRLTAAELTRAFPRANSLRFLSGTDIIAQNTSAYSLFYVLSGKVQVYRKLKNGGRLILAELGKGAFVGELALMTTGRRSANVRAETAVTLLEIDARDFNDLLRDGSPLASKLGLYFSCMLSHRLHNMLDLLVKEAEKRAPSKDPRIVHVPHVLRTLYANCAV